MSIGSPLPKRLVIGANAHADLKAYLLSRRPDLEIRGARMLEVTQDDLNWGEVYIGFRRPPTESLGAVRWIHCTGAGVDAWMAPPLDDDILLTRTPESFGPAIAEWVVARIFAHQQGLRRLDVAQRDRVWATGADSPMVHGTRALVLGTGDVGGAVARLLTAVGVHVVGVSRSGVSREPAFATVYPTNSLGELVGSVNWIVCTLPITPQTRHLVNRDLLSRCSGAVLLNAGRGAVVHEAALVEALDKGWLGGAVLDVFEVEPLPAESPLWNHPKVVISPHSSGPTTIAGAGDGFLECLGAIERGERPAWTIDRARGY